mgnify:CR=1 FL=1
MTLKTLEEARQYRYGAWAGHPKGDSYQEGYCIEEVYPRVAVPYKPQCGKKVTGDSPFCFSHDPQRRVEAATRARLKRESDDKVVDLGDGLLKRLGVTGHVPMHHRELRHTEYVMISFKEVEKLLERLGS